MFSRDLRPLPARVCSSRSDTITSSLQQHTGRSERHAKAVRQIECKARDDLRLQARLVRHCQQLLCPAGRYAVYCNVTPQVPSSSLALSDIVTSCSADTTAGMEGGTAGLGPSKPIEAVQRRRFWHVVFVGQSSKCQRRTGCDELARVVGAVRQQVHNPVATMEHVRSSPISFGLYSRTHWG